MADLFARIKPKKSSTPGEVPLAADLEVSELAVNTADGKLFTKHTDNTIVTIAGGGGGGGALNDLSDVTITAPAPVFKTDFEGVFPDLLNGSGGAVSTEQAHGGTKSFKATGAFGAINFGQILKDGAARYDCWSFWFYPTQALNTTYRLSLGGTLPTIASGGGYAIYTRDTGFGLYSSGSFVELGTRPTIAAGQWHHVFVQIDFGTNDRFKTGPSKASIWIDGALCLNNATWPQAMTAYTSNDLGLVFRLAESSTGTAHDKYIDDLRICQTDTPIAAMTEATIVPATVDAAIDATPYGIVPNMALVYDGAEWVPGYPEYYPPTTGSIPITALNEVSYSSNILTFTAANSIFLGGPNTPSTDKVSVYSNATYGAALSQYLASDTNQGSFLFAHRTKGIDFKSSTDLLHVSGAPNLTNNQPEIRICSGNQTATTPTGYYVGFKLPAGITANKTFVIPAVDGNAGAALTTNGSGTLGFTDMISKATLKAQVAASTDFADFQARIAAL